MIELAASAFCLVAFLALLAVALSGCGPVWPQVCVADEKGIACRCSEIRLQLVDHPTKPEPAGQARILCDGEPLPVYADGDTSTVLPRKRP